MCDFPVSLVLPFWLPFDSLSLLFRCVNRDYPLCSSAFFVVSSLCSAPFWSVFVIFFGILLCTKIGFLLDFSLTHSHFFSHPSQLSRFSSPHMWWNISTSAFVPSPLSLSCSTRAHSSVWVHRLATTVQFLFTSNTAVLFVRPRVQRFVHRRKTNTRIDWQITIYCLPWSIDFLQWVLIVIDRLIDCQQITSCRRFLLLTAQNFLQHLKTKESKSSR